MSSEKGTEQRQEQKSEQQEQERRRLEPQAPDALWQLEWGATALAGGGVRFRAWSPRAASMAVKVLGPAPALIPMRRRSDDIFEVVVPELGAGADYFYIIDEEKQRPDPVSRWQPAGVHGPSRVFDAEAHDWTDDGWRGLPLEDYLIYELHVGAFTPAGTFEAVREKLPYLKRLGVTAIELMPVAEFPGGRNWGYDGVHPFAPQSTYGGPAALKRLVDAAHNAGLAVVLDVVYNHLGPEGNYLRDYASYFSSSYNTPWGEAVNFDGPESDGVRRYFKENALYWLTEYHIDALRLDAIHRIYDTSPRHFLAELREDFQRQAAKLNRLAWLIAESDLNDVRIISPQPQCGYGLDAQWNDDFHHSLHALLTGTRRGYFADFGSLGDLHKALAEGFVNDGRKSVARRKRHGTSSLERPGQQFVIYIQNHDQVANSYWGERLSRLVSLEQQKMAAVILLCGSNLPLLFMGQEYGEAAPFYFFTSHMDASLIEDVRRGRRLEYEPYAEGRVYADPQDPQTFERSKLVWSRLDEQSHAQLLRFYTDLIALRRTTASLSSCDKKLMQVEHDEGRRWLRLKRTHPSGPAALVVCNLSAQEQTVTVANTSGDNWRLALLSASRLYGGEHDTDALHLHIPTEPHGPMKIALPPWTAAVYLQTRP